MELKWRTLSDTPDRNHCFCIIGWVGKHSGLNFYDIAQYAYGKYKSDTIPDKVYDTSGEQNYLWLAIPSFPSELIMQGYETQMEIIKKVLGNN